MKEVLVCLLIAALCSTLASAYGQRSLLVNLYALRSDAKYNLVLGNSANEDLLLSYCEVHGVSSLMLANLESVLPGRSLALGNFISQARDRGVRTVLGLSPNVTARWLEIAQYQNATTDARRFDGAVCVTDFWTTGPYAAGVVNTILMSRHHYQPAGRMGSAFQYAAYVGTTVQNSDIQQLTSVVDTFVIISPATGAATAFASSQQVVSSILAANKQCIVQYSAFLNRMGTDLSLMSFGTAESVFVEDMRKESLSSTYLTGFSWDNYELASLTRNETYTIPPTTQAPVFLGLSETEQDRIQVYIAAGIVAICAIAALLVCISVRFCGPEKKEQPAEDKSV